MSTTNFNEYRFKGFKYQDQSHKYWDFKDQVNDDESKVLIRINLTMFSATLTIIMAGEITC